MKYTCALKKKAFLSLPAGRYGIMLACWQGEPRERPTFPALVEILGDLLQDNNLPVRNMADLDDCNATFIQAHMVGLYGLGSGCLTCKAGIGSPSHGGQV